MTEAERKMHERTRPDRASDARPELRPTSTESARYIAELAAEMVVIAKAAGLDFVAHLLAMSQAEAEYEFERHELGSGSTGQDKIQGKAKKLAPTVMIAPEEL